MLLVGKSVLPHTAPVALALSNPGFRGCRALQQPDFGNQERANLGRILLCTGSAHGNPGTLNHWRSPGGIKQHWDTEGALPAWVLAQTSCLCQGMCHTPITLLPLSLPQCLCSYAHNTLSQMLSAPYLLTRQMRSSGLVQSVPFFLVLGRGNFSLMTQGKIQELHFRSFNSFISFTFTIYLDDSLSGDMALDGLLACPSLFWEFRIPPLRPFVPLLSSKGESFLQLQWDLRSCPPLPTHHIPLLYPSLLSPQWSLLLNLPLLPTPLWLPDFLFSLLISFLVPTSIHFPVSLCPEVPGSPFIPCCKCLTAPAAPPSVWHSLTSPGPGSSSAAAGQVHPSGAFWSWKRHGKETSSSHFQGLIPRGLAVPGGPGFLYTCGNVPREVTSIFIWMGQEADRSRHPPS